jgi:hypothetical protein
VSFDHRNTQSYRGLTQCRQPRLTALSRVTSLAAAISTDPAEEPGLDHRGRVFSVGVGRRRKSNPNNKKVPHHIHVHRLFVGVDWLVEPPRGTYFFEDDGFPFALAPLGAKAAQLAVPL